MVTTELLDPFLRLLADVCPPSEVRAIENGGPADSLWQAFEESGFLDALVPESAGGAGLTLADIGPLVMALGSHSVPVPVAETMVTRARLAIAGKDRPSGPIALGAENIGPTPYARVSSHLLARTNNGAKLFSLSPPHAQATGVRASLSADIAWEDLPVVTELGKTGVDTLALGAILHAGAIAGAADRLLEMTVAYANERQQFGKPVGRQQAVQQQLAVMAELVIASRMAAAMGFAGELAGNRLLAAIAKQRTSAAASEIANIAHAVHGAIGISEEHDLQLYTRRLREARLAFGSEGYWARELGQIRLRENMPTVDFLRHHTLASAEDAAE